ncbi:ABC transporter ATP-binding protein [Aerococcus sanguinicola]|uniref:ABC transporter ATP-binding protein n=2 Tax=Aerococcus TaxID=1375 RepID=UPI0008A4D3E8|nr:MULTISPECIES: ABC transporter ATP-binding protein [unclassified Aerococcus]KAB0646523.1 ABC transporter ATP-binding protein [Aerococcus sanguinicola]MDK6233815.1 ABC transporter ATP-binding protein [Aerococcus sp. UMB10185]MDK6855895.1 ABC transporter ATP-binding protein [Aerococcus sp. UMB7533]OFN03936.1 spermidine/putrescine ABC transporter ATP-binding protein [Aerococcus sp. HMSC062A02]OHO43507.1 spermidine/putrescine ABC transporter ATP-binding protein [Aerococcus sp. HMSC035B07]
MASIEFKGVTKRYAEGQAAVRDFNLKINDGELLVLVGPSGCGKSTLMRLLAGLESLSEGEILIDGQVVNDIDPKDRNVAMVFQNYALYPHLNVRQNLGFSLKLRKEKPAVIDRRVEEVAQKLDLADLLDRKPSQLSGGQRQRVALGRAIVREPNVFLLDEPLSNLDAKLRVQMRYEISRIQQELGATMLYVTHDQTEAMTMGDRIVVMRDGRIQQLGRPDELYQAPANCFVAEFLGSPQMNIFPTVLDDQVLNLWGQAYTTPGQLSQETCLLGVRPENLEVVAGASHRLTLVENLGSERYLYLEGEEGRLCVKTDSQAPLEVGQAYSLQIKDPRALSYFDPQTKEALL